MPARDKTAEEVEKDRQDELFKTQNMIKQLEKYPMLTDQAKRDAKNIRSEKLEEWTTHELMQLQTKLAELVNMVRKLQNEPDIDTAEVKWTPEAQNTNIVATRFQVEPAAEIDMQLLESMYPSIKWPSQGQSGFQFPDGTSSTEVVGLVLAYHNTRTLWEGKFGDDQRIPACSSMSGTVGTIRNSAYYKKVTNIDVGSDDATMSCSRCPASKFSSKNGERVKPACQQRLIVWMLIDGEPAPLRMSIPVTAMRGFQRYVARNGGPASLCTRLTFFELKDIELSVDIAGNLKGDSLTWAEQYRDAMMPEMSATGVNPAEYEGIGRRIQVPSFSTFDVEDVNTKVFENIGSDTKALPAADKEDPF